MATRVPVRQVRDRIPVAVRARPSSLTRWAAAEMRRHDVRMVTEALAATTNFDSRRWFREVDVPTALMVTTGDRAVPAHEQLRLLVSVPGASVHQYDEGHTWCAKASFGRAVTEVCLEVASAARS